MMGKMPGETLEKKAENLRAAYGFMMSHPGKKLLFMGQDFGQIDEWNENASLEWELLQYPLHKNMQSYVRALNHMVLEHPALYEEDFDPSGLSGSTAAIMKKAWFYMYAEAKTERKRCSLSATLIMWSMRNSVWEYRLQANIRKSSTVTPGNSAVRAGSTPAQRARRRFHGMTERTPSNAISRQ